VKKQQSRAARWPELAREIGVIVIGVLIALAAQQVVDALHWRDEVKHARAALADDFAGDIALADERREIAPCLASRLQEIAGILEGTAKTGRLPPVGLLGAPPLRTWTATSWDSVLSSQTAAHLPREELVTFGTLAEYGRQLTRNNDQELDAWTELYAIVGPGRSITPDERAHLLAAIGRAHFAAKDMTQSSEQLTAWIRRSGIAKTGKWPDDPNPTGKSMVCRPIGPAPSGYGAAPHVYELPGWKA